MAIAFRAALAAACLLVFTMPVHAAGVGAPPAPEVFVPTSLDQLLAGEACAQCDSNSTGTRAFWNLNGRSCTEEETAAGENLQSLEEDGGERMQSVEGRVEEDVKGELDRSCAICEPSCNSGGYMSGTEAEVSEWYANNSCDAWRCRDNSLLEALAEHQTLTVEALASLVSSSSGRLRVNRARGSIQLYGCDGRIARNFDLATTVANDLESALGALTASR